MPCLCPWELWDRTVPDRPGFRPPEVVFGNRNDSFYLSVGHISPRGHQYVMQNVQSKSNDLVAQKPSSIISQEKPPDSRPIITPPYTVDKDKFLRPESLWPGVNSNTNAGAYAPIQRGGQLE